LHELLIRYGVASDSGTSQIGLCEPDEVIDAKVENPDNLAPGVVDESRSISAEDNLPISVG
jgi:hypothetical protein